MDVLWIMIPFLVLVLVGFFLAVFFLPEWVGITGNHAKSITAHQQGLDPDDPLHSSPPVKKTPESPEKPGDPL